MMCIWSPPDVRDVVRLKTALPSTGDNYWLGQQQTFVHLVDSSRCRLHFSINAFHSTHYYYSKVGSQIASTCAKILGRFRQGQVFHGADNDVSWLQRDFGLYVVNMFDTHQAARILRPPGSDGRVDRGEYSLANLLSRYCQVTADKQYQTADWRFMAVDAHSLDR